MTRSTQFADFTARPAERDLIMKIASRAADVGRANGVSIPAIDVAIDLTVVHGRYPLRLADLLAANDFNFIHDVLGIRDHLDRDTGELTHCFRPRFTERRAA